MAVPSAADIDEGEQRRIGASTDDSGQRVRRTTHRARGAPPIEPLERGSTGALDEVQDRLPGELSACWFLAGFV